MAEIDTSNPRDRITIRTVAADAGVSVAAVSKVLRNAYGVSDGLRQKVNESIDRLGYRPSVAARGMRGQTYTIGILLVEIANPFLTEVIAGVNAVAGRAGYKVLMGMGESQMPVETSLIESMIDFRMDGLVLVAPQLAGQKLESFAAQIPMAVVGHHEPTARNFDTVNAHDFEGARIAVRALLERGYRDIAMAGLAHSISEDTNVAYQRELGYRAEMTAAGLESSIRIRRFSHVSADTTAQISAFLSAPDRPRALFCWSDLHAVPILNVARTLGLRLPQDIAILGYDNSPIAALPVIDLASIEQQGRRLGTLATEALLTRIAGRDAPHHILIEPSLALRSSI